MSCNRQPLGLCDAFFAPEPFARQHDQALIGLPDTIWFPENAYMPALAPSGAQCNLVLFPVDDPSVFDAVICDEFGYVQEVQVKKKAPGSNWIWGAVTVQGEAFHRLKLLWESRHRADKYLGELTERLPIAEIPAQGKSCGELHGRGDSKAIAMRSDCPSCHAVQEWPKTQFNPALQRLNAGF